jgi:hypothetical protein
MYVQVTRSAIEPCGLFNVMGVPSDAPHLDSALPMDIDQPSRIFALLVGIDDYPLDPITGAVRDVENVYNYLRYDRGVNAEAIVVLTNAQATRRAILDAFTAHLIENREIVPGDAILFHFSGHGSRGPAPEGWTVASDSEREIELIVPVDAVRDPSLARGGEEGGIPDRTLGALLRRLAREKGNNVTVVLDCCHSGHGTRSMGKPAQSYRTRKIHPRVVGRLTPDTDREIWGEEELTPTPGFARGGFLDESHILLAACQRTEEAIGSEQGASVLCTAQHPA